MKEPARAALSYWLSTTEDNTTHKEETLTTYCHTVIYLLEIYATDNEIAQAKANIMHYK